MLFQVGKVHWSREVLRHSGILKEDLVKAFEQFMRGDWGEVSESKNILNDIALTNGEEIVGCYVSKFGIPFYIRADAAGTYVMLYKEDEMPQNTM